MQNVCVDLVRFPNLTMWHISRPSTIWFVTFVTFVSFLTFIAFIAWGMAKRGAAWTELYLHSLSHCCATVQLCHCATAVPLCNCATVPLCNCAYMATQWTSFPVLIVLMTPAATDNRRTCCVRIMAAGDHPSADTATGTPQYCFRTPQYCSDTIILLKHHNTA